MSDTGTSSVHRCAICGQCIGSVYAIDAYMRLYHTTCLYNGHHTEAAELRQRLEQAERGAAQMHVALSLVSGALCDASDIPVPDEVGYGDAVREITKQRNEAIAKLGTAEAKLRLASAIVDAARNVEKSCDFDVPSGHGDDIHRDDCVACEMDDAIAALDTAIHQGEEGK